MRTSTGHLGASKGKMITFVDGENIVIRFQDMLNKGYKKNNEISHEKDVFVWKSDFTRFQHGFNHVRLLYYTSAVGDDDRISTLTERLGDHVYQIDRRFT